MGELSTSSRGGRSFCSSRPSRFSAAVQRTRPGQRRHLIDLPCQRARPGQRRVQLELRSRLRLATTRGDATTRSPQKGSAVRSGSITTSTSDTTLTSITAYENTESKSLGDIDGGFGADFLPFVGPCPPGSQPGDPCILFPSTHPGRHRRPRPVHAGVPARLAGERAALLAGGRLLLRLEVLRYDAAVLRPADHRHTREHGVGRVRPREL